MTNRIPAKSFDPQADSGIQVIKFYADWCAPCKVFAPIFDTAADANLEATFASLNIEDEGGREIARDYGIRSIPAVIFLKDGVKIASSNHENFHDVLKEVLSAE